MQVLHDLGPVLDLGDELLVDAGGFGLSRVWHLTVDNSGGRQQDGGEPQAGRDGTDHGNLSGVGGRVGARDAVIIAAAEAAVQGRPPVSSTFHAPRGPTVPAALAVT